MGVSALVNLIFCTNPKTRNHPYLLIPHPPLYVKQQHQRPWLYPSLFVLHSLFPDSSFTFLPFFSSPPCVVSGHLFLSLVLLGEQNKAHSLVSSRVCWNLPEISLLSPILFLPRGNMDQFNNSDIEFVGDNYYYDFEDEDDNPFLETQQPPCSDLDEVDSDFESDFETDKAKTDTSAWEARNGKDIQGIPWERLNYTRDQYRERRLKLYKNYESLSRSREELDKECLQVEMGKKFYDFQFNTRLVKSTIVHFQNYSVMHWSALHRRSQEVMNVAKPVISAPLCPGLVSPSLSRVQISTMSIGDNLLVAGGFQGELICKPLNKTEVAFATRMTAQDNAITNCVDIFRNCVGSLRVIAANNDAKIRVFDALTFTALSCWSFDWSINNTSVSPDGKLLAVLGDSEDCLISDAQSGKTISCLKGHLDYSFASAWHPDGRILATGNQDTTCRLWDIRNTSQSLAVLKGNMGAIRAIKFTLDGRFMAMAEPADFVHIFDTQSGFVQGQEIDLFGEIAGISFSPDTEALFVGVADRTYGSLLEFNRSRCFRGYTDCFV